MSATYLITLESDQGLYTLRLLGSNAIQAATQAATIERAPLRAIVKIEKES